MASKASSEVCIGDVPPQAAVAFSDPVHNSGAITVYDGESIPISTNNSFWLLGLEDAGDPIGDLSVHASLDSGGVRDGESEMVLARPMHHGAGSSGEIVNRQVGKEASGFPVRMNPNPKSDILVTSKRKGSPWSALWGFNSLKNDSEKL
ncbi:hypothetical protein Nepgr_031970 [Nepenthes gracilis]|uniref:Uncharacterized protein n=1 Tax=Nepenthes gracilis TaxID=150966 RepID=A0AAD3TIJ5_NEPGR|nr:hypothetical protein Nepgr_031970 [Nepenthes gracilis]